MFQYEYLKNIHKKATIGNVIKKCIVQFNTKCIIYAYDEFRLESI